ncbi:alpha/beta hydrolase [Allostella vacuolata]|nr:alpha/beta hydrolase [Stella vacuolata]
MATGGWLVAGAAAAAVTGWAIRAAWRRDMAAARAPLAGRARLFQGPSGPIEYAEAGPAAGPPVLMVHGSGGGFDHGLGFGAALARHGLRVIAPSRFGYLGSPMPREAVPAEAMPAVQADALAHLLAGLGRGPVVVVGGSAGALSATQLVLRHPHLCRALVLLVPTLHVPGRRAGAGSPSGAAVAGLVRAVLGSDFLFWLAMRAAPGLMTRLVLATDPALLAGTPESERRRLRDVLFHILPVSARRAGILADTASAAAPPPYPVERIACPVLVIGTRDDLYGTAAAAIDTAARTPGARLRLFDTGGHLWVGHDRDLWATVAAFVDGLDA